jgi:hypothetical protein
MNTVYPARHQPQANRSENPAVLCGSPPDVMEMRLLSL